LLLWSACSRSASPKEATEIDAAAESYVRLVLALGERDADSLDSYHGPPAWREEARQRHVTLKSVQHDAQALAGTLSATTFQTRDDEIRRALLLRQLRAVVARVEILDGARPPFADEVRRLFGLDTVPSPSSDGDANEIRAAIDRELPGPGTTTERFAAFD